jgi:hypothetical protein
MMGETAIVFAGVDPGLVAMEETAMKTRLYSHINRYAPLAHPDDDIDMDVRSTMVSQNMTVQCLSVRSQRS